MTNEPQRGENDDAEPNSGAEAGPGRGSEEADSRDPGAPATAGTEDRWGKDRWAKDHSAEVPRTAGGALPPRVIIIALLIFAVGFYLFRRWRQQYVTYGVESSGELPAVLAMLGLG